MTPKNGGNVASLALLRDEENTVTRVCLPTRVENFLMRLAGKGLNRLRSIEASGDSCERAELDSTQERNRATHTQTHTHVYSDFALLPAWRSLDPISPRKTRQLTTFYDVSHYYRLFAETCMCYKLCVRVCVFMRETVQLTVYRESGVREVCPKRVALLVKNRATQSSLSANSQPAKSAYARHDGRDE